MMQLYSYYRSSASYRVRVALQVKGLDYKHHGVHLVRGGGEQHAPAYKALNPQQQVPTLIVGAKYDCICPFSLFKNDQRFHRKNIKLLFIEDAGHLPWVENPAAIREAFQELYFQLSGKKQ